MEDHIIIDATAAAEIETGDIMTKIIPVFPAAPLPAGNLPKMTAGINLPAAPEAPAGAVEAAGPEIPASVRIRRDNRETIEWMSFG